MRTAVAPGCVSEELISALLVRIAFRQLSDTSAGSLPDVGGIGLGR